jgi:hypothetical protein
VFDGEVTAALLAADCLDGAAVFVLVAVLVMDFRRRPAREGRQTHQDAFDELAFQGWEPATTTTSRTAAKIAKRLMG